MSLIIVVQQDGSVISATTPTVLPANVTVLPPPVAQIISTGLVLQGPPGDSTTLFSYIAGESLSSGRAVIKSAGKVYYYNPNNVTHAGRSIGITTTSASLDGTVSVKYSGTITDAAFSFTVDKPIFVGLSGQLFTIVPNVSIIQQIGISLSATNMIIDFHSPIIKI